MRQFSFSERLQRFLLSPFTGVDMCKVEETPLEYTNRRFPKPKKQHFIVHHTTGTASEMVSINQTNRQEIRINQNRKVANQLQTIINR